MAAKTKRKSKGGTRRKARAKTATIPKRRRAKTVRKKSFSRKKSGRIRPVVIVSGDKFSRPAKSKYFSKPTRINRRRKSYRRRARRNPIGGLPIRRAFSKQTIFRYASLGGGIGLGALLSRFLNTGAVPFMAAPASPPEWVVMLQKARPVHGFIHILVGVTIASKVRNQYGKDVGAGLAALGGFDLLTQTLTFMGIQGLPTFSGMNVDLMGMNVDQQMPMAVGGYSDGGDFIDSLDT